MRVLRRSGPADESGMTLVELLVAMAILGLVMATAAAGFINLTDTTKSTDAKSHANDALRSALEQIARDLRAANPIEVQTPVSSYDQRVGFEVYCQGDTTSSSTTSTTGNCPTNSFRHVRWELTAGYALQRIVNGGTPAVVLGPDTGSSLPLAQRQLAVVNSPTQPVFTYLRKDGSVLQTASPGDLATAFRDCTRAVKIRLVAIAEPGLTNRPVELSTTVSLRNYNEVSAC